MNPLLLLSSARFYLRHPAQASLALVGICLGVTVFVGVTLAIDSATRAFEQSAQFVRGRATHRLLPVGRELTDDTYVELVRRRGLRSAPILETTVRIDDSQPRRATLLGIDPIEEAEFRDFSAFAPGGGSTTALIVEPSTVLVAPGLLGEHDDTARLTITTGTGIHELRVLGTLGTEARDLIVTDLSTAQEITAQLGRLSRIDLILTTAEAHALEQSLPVGTALVSASNENAQFAELSRAFAINVSALGLIAVVVGAFLIYSTMAFAVVRRRKSLAILRTLGVSQRELMETLAVEALAIGVVGAALGVVLGAVLATALVGGVAATIDDFAFRSAVAVARPSPWLYAEGFALGVIATLIAAARPLVDAARTDPSIAMQRVALERRSARWVARAPIAAGVLLLLAACVLLLPTRNLHVAFVGIALVLAAGSLLAPASIVALTRVAEPMLAHAGGLYGRLAARSVRAHQSRIAVAAAALTLAVATVIGVGVMIGSFRVSLARWLDTTLTSDVFLSADDGFEPGSTVARLSRLPQVSGISETRFVEVPTSFGDIGLRAFAPATRGFGLHIVDGDEPAAVDELAAGTHIAIAEPFAYRHELRRGDSLELPTPRGARRFPIAGVYRDYNTGGASVLMPLDLYRELWNDPLVNTIGLELVAPLDSTTLAAALGSDTPALRTTRTDTIKEVSLEIFDRTFAITTVLRTLAALVAFIGMLSALLAIQLERRRETAVLRALGFPPRGIGVLTLTETSLIGTAAGAVAVPFGLVLATLLVYVINRRSFGWSLDLDIEIAPMAVGVGLAIAASVLAGLFPSLEQIRDSKTAVLQYE